MRRIKARVIRNIGTEAQWLQKNPILGDGEQALVRFGGRIRYKIGDGSLTFSQLSYQDNDMKISIAAPSFPFQSGEGPAPAGVYMANGSGKYNGNLDVDTNGKLVMLIWDGISVLEKVENPLPKGADGKTTETFNSAKPAGYLAGDQVYFGGSAIYSALVNIPVGQSPLTNPEKWKLELSGETETLQTYNKATEEVFKTGQSINITTGALQTQVGSKCLFKIPVTPSTQLYAPNYLNATVVLYKENGDFLRTELSIRVLANFIPVPADSYFVSYNILATATLETIFASETKYFEAPLYIKPKITKFAEYLELKNTADITRSTINPIFLNENRNFSRISSVNTSYTLNQSGNATIIKTTDEYLNRIGILELSKAGDYATAITLTMGVTFAYSPVNTTIRNRYIHASVFFVTDDLSLVPDLNVGAFSGTASDDTLKVATLLKKGIVKIKDGLWRFDVVCRVLDFDYKSFSARFTISPNIITSGKIYAFSNVAYAFSNIHHKVPTLYPERFGQNRLLYTALELQSSPYWYLNSKILNKTFNLYGTSIEASNYILRLGEAYSATIKNFGQGGGGVIFDMDLNPNPNREIHLKKCITISRAEKIAEVARQGYTPATESELNTSYDVSILQNLDSALFMFGTYGINDRMYPRAYATDQEFDRKSIYGAYNYILRELFTAKPSAKVVIFGQHTFSGWSDMNKVNDVQRMVAKKWGIPFLDWGMELAINQVTVATYAPDGAHFSAAGRELAAEYLITKLKQYIF